MKTIKLPSGIFEYDPSKPLGCGGGFGQVFDGRTVDGEEIAVKKLHLSMADLAHREISIVEELKGRVFEYVIPFIDAGKDADTDDYFIIMLKAKESLQDFINRRGIVKMNEAVSILLNITNGLREVGDLVHRDLKPDNILFHEGKWKIADFGIARFVQEATASNTLKYHLNRFYAAPEQWRSERATNATDIYALGCIGFCLLTGKPPFIANPEEEHQKEPLPIFFCEDSRLTALINKMAEKLPRARPTSSRVYDVLVNISVPQQLSSALAELTNAGAQVAHKEQRLAAQKQAEEIDRRERMQFAVSALRNLSVNITRLEEKIKQHVPHIQKDLGRNDVFRFRLGDGLLEINLSKASLSYVEPGTFKRSGWDVITAAEILVHQTGPHYIWSASLWYTKIKGALDYRWYEVSYCKWGNAFFEPFACLDFKEADYAASNFTSSTGIAYGPKAIDDEGEVEFHDRWIWLLGKSVLGQLRHPSALPINSWPPRF